MMAGVVNEINKWARHIRNKVRIIIAVGANIFATVSTSRFLIHFQMTSHLKPPFVFYCLLAFYHFALGWHRGRVSIVLKCISPEQKCFMTKCLTIELQKKMRETVKTGGIKSIYQHQSSQADYKSESSAICWYTKTGWGSRSILVRIFATKSFNIYMVEIQLFSLE